MPRKGSNKRGIRGARINFGVICHAVQRAIEQQQQRHVNEEQVPQIPIQVELNVTGEEIDEEEAAEPQEIAEEQAAEPQEIDDQAADPPDHNITPKMCKYV